MRRHCLGLTYWILFIGFSPLLNFFYYYSSSMGYWDEKALLEGLHVCMYMYIVISISIHT